MRIDPHFVAMEKSNLALAAADDLLAAVHRLPPSEELALHIEGLEHVRNALALIQERLAYMAGREVYCNVD